MPQDRAFRCTRFRAANRPAPSRKTYLQCKPAGLLNPAMFAYRQAFARLSNLTQQIPGFVARVARGRGRADQASCLAPASPACRVPRGSTRGHSPAHARCRPPAYFNPSRPVVPICPPALSGRRLCSLAAEVATAGFDVPFQSSNFGGSAEIASHLWETRAHAVWSLSQKERKASSPPNSWSMRSTNSTAT